MDTWTKSPVAPDHVEKTITLGAGTIVISRPVLPLTARAELEEKTRTALERAMSEYLNP